MGLDKDLVDHLDKTDDIKENLLSEIDSVLKKLDVDDLIEDIAGTLEQALNVIQGKIEDSYEEIAKTGLELAEVVKKDMIQIQDTKDPTLNKEDNGQIR